MKLFLIGFMGAGKSAIGARLAERMGMEFVDLDRVIETGAGCSVARFFEAEGEGQFRRLESQALRELCSRQGDLLIAVGGGAPVVPGNMDLMRAAGLTVWLDPAFEVVAGRLDAEDRRRRPLFESLARARELFAERRSAYAEADVRIEPDDGASTDETATKVFERLERHRRGALLVRGNGIDR